MSMNNWNPFQAPLVDDSNGLRLNMVSPSGSTSPNLGFGLSRPSAMGNGMGNNGLGNFSTDRSFRTMGQPSSSSTVMFNQPARGTSPFSQQTMPSFQSFDNFSTRNAGLGKNFTGFQQGASGNDAFEPKLSSNGWNSMNGYGFGGKPTAPVWSSTSSKFGSIGGASSSFGSQFNEPYQRNNTMTIGMFGAQTSPPLPTIGSGGDIFSQADMFSVGSDSRKQQSVDNFKAGRWDAGPSRPGEPGGQVARETGIIEKLLHSYGFIQCCERQARLFFHFSQFDGNIEHLKIGDPVEFEMTYDRRTGKPIASTVSKISSEVVSQQMQGEERVIGTVTTELSPGGPGRPEIYGRISYESRGECFFLPYGRSDIEGHVTLSVGDRVSFLIATDQRTGNLAARCVRLENPAAPVRYRGIVGSISGDDGFIDRGDVVRQIGFLVSELDGEDVKVGSHVEFSIQTVNGKELAGSIKRLPDGTVVFEDIEPEEVRGQVLKTPERRDSPDLVAPNLLSSPNSMSSSMFGNGDGMSGKWTPPSSSSMSSMGGGSSAAQNRAAMLSGRIRYRGKDRSEVEIPFGENDQKGNFTLRHGDWVSFHVASDRRDQQHRATKIRLLDESFTVSAEKRELGVIRKLEKESDEKPAEGLIECPEREEFVNFTVHELLDENEELRVKDEVELTVVEKWQPAGGSRSTGLRIKKLPKGSVLFHLVCQTDLTGEVTKEASREKKDTPGLILVDNEHVPPENANTELPFFLEEKDEDMLVDQEESPPEVGDKVKFDLVLVRKNKKLAASRVRVVEARPPLFDANTELPPMPLSNQYFDDFLSSPNLAAILAPVPDTLPSPLMPLMASGRTPSASPMALSPAPMQQSQQLVNLDEPRIEELVKPNGLLGVAPPPPPAVARRPLNAVMLKGYIACVKERDGFGFIEKMSRDSDVYFRLASFEGDVAALESGAEVLYCVGEKVHQSGRESAGYVTLAPTGSTPTNTGIRPEMLLGVVLRPLKYWKPDQPEYCGLVKNGTSDDAEGQVYEFGVTSVTKRVQLQVGDAVQFQVETTTGKAVNIKPCRNKLRATVDAVKGNYGFLSYEYEEGKKLYYSQTEVKDMLNLQVGDQVEFELVTNKRNGKTAACSVVKLSDSPTVVQRPERLISRLRAMNVVQCVKVSRQPRGPDGTKGFHRAQAQNGTIPSPPSSPVSMASSIASL